MERKRICMQVIFNCHYNERETIIMGLNNKERIIMGLNKRDSMGFHDYNGY